LLLRPAVCTGIALTLSEVPAALLDRGRLRDQVYDRDGRPEVQFHLWQNPPLLPVRWEGRLQVVRWGCPERRGHRSFGGWLTEEQLAAGLLAALHPEPVVIPANLGHHKGTWFLITTGIRGVILPGVPGGPAAFMLVKPATNYYRNMTEQEPLMPVLVDQVI
jgi:hypothetical protein